jgi:hypothetical protein
VKNPEVAVKTFLSEIGGAIRGLIVNYDDGEILTLLFECRECPGDRLSLVTSWDQDGHVGQVSFWRGIVAIEPLSGAPWFPWEEQNAWPS